VVPDLRDSFNSALAALARGPAEQGDWEPLWAAMEKLKAAEGKLQVRLAR
jgi:hypothetical protein